MTVRASLSPGNPSAIRRWATTRQTATYLQVGERTVRRMIADGHITAHRMGRRLVRIDLAEVDHAFSVLPSGAALVRGALQ